MRTTAATICCLLLVACSGSSPSMEEYGNRLNEIRDTFAPQAEAAWRCQIPLWKISRR